MQDQNPIPQPPPQQPQQPLQPAPQPPQQPQQPQQPAPQPPQPPQQQTVQQTARPAQVPPQRPLQGAPRQGQPNRPGSRLPQKPANPKGMIFGCVGFLIFAILLYIIFVVVFVSQTTAGDNSLAQALGVDPAEFTNSLILLTNVIFGFIVIISFIVSIFGIFRAAMAPKGDVIARKNGYKQAGIAGLVFFVFLAIWVAVFIYLSGKQVAIVPEREQSTITFSTEPQETLQQTAPFDVIFDAAPIQANTPAQFEILTYEWDFGDGDLSNAPRVTHTYTEVGRYTAMLTVTALNTQTQQEQTQQFSKVITIATAEVSAVFTADPESGSAPLTVEFDGSESSSPGGKITSYDWDFEGRRTFRDDSGEQVSYTFEREGQYEVGLRVADNTGQFSEPYYMTINIVGENAPTAEIEIPTDDGNYYVGEQITFLGEDSESPNGEIEKYQWDFGDESTQANTRTATHTYNQPGTYEVTLTVTDEENSIGTSRLKIELENREAAPIAQIDTVPQLEKDDESISGTLPLEVSFSAAGSSDPDNNIVEYKWDFDGDGEFDETGESVKYVYKQSGVFNATLLVVDALGNESKAIRVIEVAEESIKARLTADIAEGTAPLTVTFDASGSSVGGDAKIASYEWDFGDGSPRKIGTSKITYKYDTIGVFTSTVTARSSDGQSSSAEFIVNVRPIDLQACFTPNAESGYAPLTVTFDPRCSQGPVITYKWDFGDGDTSRARRPDHTFQVPGSYTVTLEVADNQNIVDTFSKDILILGEINQ